MEVNASSTGGSAWRATRRDHARRRGWPRSHHDAPLRPPGQEDRRLAVSWGLRTSVHAHHRHHRRIKMDARGVPRCTARGERACRLDVRQRRGAPVQRVLVGQLAAAAKRRSPMRESSTATTRSSPTDGAPSAPVPRGRPARGQALTRRACARVPRSLPQRDPGPGRPRSGRHRAADRRGVSAAACRA